MNIGIGRIALQRKGALLGAGLFVGAVAAGAFALGLVLAVIGTRYGPAVMVGLPIAAAVAIAAYRKPVVAVGALVLALPAGNMRGVAGFEIAWLAALAASGLVILSRALRRRKAIVWVRQFWWLVALTAVFGVSASQALNPTFSSMIVARWVIGAVLAVVVVSACDNMDDLRRLLMTFLVVGAVVCLMAVATMQQFEVRTGAQNVDNRLTGIFSQPNELGTFAGFVAVGAVGAVFSARSRRTRVLMAACGGAGLAALLLTLSRGAWIGAAGGLVAFAVMYPRARRALLTVAVLAVAAATVAFAVAPQGTQVQVLRERFKTISKPMDNPYDDRPTIYNEAIREIQARPLLGFGPGGFLEASARSVSEARTVQALHARNALLTVAAESGLVAALLVAAMTVSLGLMAYRSCRTLRRRPRDAAVVAGVGAALFTLVGHGLVDYALLNPALFVSTFVVFGMLLAGGHLAGADEPTDPERPPTESPAETPAEPQAEGRVRA